MLSFLVEKLTSMWINKAKRKEKKNRRTRQQKAKEAISSLAGIHYMACWGYIESGNWWRECEAVNSLNNTKFAGATLQNQVDNRNESFAGKNNAAHLSQSYYQIQCFKRARKNFVAVTRCFAATENNVLRYQLFIRTLDEMQLSKAKCSAIFLRVIC